MANEFKIKNGAILGKIKPASNSATAVQINNAADTITLINVDTTNNRVSIGKTGPGYTLDVNDTFNAPTIYENGILLTNKYLQLSGGILTGPLYIAGTDNATKFSIQDSSGSTDLFKISNGTGSSAPVITISTFTSGGFDYVDFVTSALKHNGTDVSLVGHTHSYLTANQTITLSGDVTGSGSTSITTTLAKIAGVGLSISGLSSGQVLKYNGTNWVNSTDTVGTGTVTSVGLSVPTGFSVGNSPITTSGTISISFASGYSLPSDSTQSNWTSAYTDTSGATSTNVVSKIVKRDSNGDTWVRRINIEGTAGAKGLRYDDNNFLSPYSHNGHMWLRNATGLYTFQTFDDADDWTRVFQLYLPDPASSGGDNLIAELGQRQSNTTTGTYKGVRITHYTGSTVQDGYLKAGTTDLSGIVTISNHTNSTSTTTGALQVQGGVGITGNAYIGGTANIQGYWPISAKLVVGATTSSGLGIVANSSDNAAITGNSPNHIGVYGQSVGYIAVEGNSTNGAGVYGISDTWYGTVGYSTSNYGGWFGSGTTGLCAEGTGAAAYFNGNVSVDGTAVISGATSNETVFNVNGTTGDLFSIVDSQEGVLFQVSDISGIPLMQVHSDGYVLQNSGQKIGLTSTSTIYSTSVYVGSAAYVDYRVSNASTGAFRAGTLMVVWDSTNSRIEYTDIATPDLYASTSGIMLSAQINSNNMQIISTITSGTWNVKLGIRVI
jgi:hypothetical protein